MPAYSPGAVFQADAQADRLKAAFTVALARQRQSELSVSKLIGTSPF